MLFRRRHPPSLIERVRVFFWPRRSWARSLRYVLTRLWRLRGTPHAIALGCAAGVFISFTPYLGLHFFLGGLIAWVLGGNIFASALGTFFGNPLTFPIIWVAAFKSGSWILGSSGDFNAEHLKEGFEKLWDGLWYLSGDVLWGAIDILWPLIKPMTVGGVPMGLAVATISYYFARKAVEAYQARRYGGGNSDNDSKVAEA